MLGLWNRYRVQYQNRLPKHEHGQLYVGVCMLKDSTLLFFILLTACLHLHTGMPFHKGINGLAGVNTMCYAPSSGAVGSMIYDRARNAVISAHGDASTSSATTHCDALKLIKRLLPVCPRNGALVWHAARRH